MRRNHWVRAEMFSQSALICGSQHTGGSREPPPRGGPPTSPPPRRKTHQEQAHTFSTYKLAQHGSHPPPIQTWVRHCNNTRFSTCAYVTRKHWAQSVGASIQLLQKSDEFIRKALCVEVSRKSSANPSCIWQRTQQHNRHQQMQIWQRWAKKVHLAHTCGMKSRICTRLFGLRDCEARGEAH